ncbi:hypothetical protein [Chthonobacter rhizosphaerae]|uniref:hypothetical protein n=1 Tax=Chthonobacter rhizosphaerae TaxID=2735553 RepID=UPI0015EE6801|nr:hypothetical protein [Chthonobacter rhizosphaerae]
MDTTKVLIAEAVSRFPLQTTTEWAKISGGRPLEIERIEAEPNSISTVDCLFDSTAKVVVKGTDTAITAHAFGRFDGRRAEVERFVFAA